MDKTELLAVLGEDKIKMDEPLKNLTSFKIGGPADALARVSTVDELIKIIRYAKDANIPYFLLGNGSNVLVSDKGYRGIIIQLSKDDVEVSVSGDTITADAGVTLSKLSQTAMNASLSGLEFASGIPGTLGGALFMNAGAYGGEMKQVVTKVKVLDTDSLHVIELSNEEMDFGYRHSILKEKNYIALGCEIKLSHSDKETIGADMRELALKRKEKQPLEYPSAGSTFKRPEGYFAGKLIEDAGLGGYSVGDAEVSEKHKGFVINKGNASAKDVRGLIDYVIKTVKEKSGVTLEPEVLFLGEF